MSTRPRAVRQALRDWDRLDAERIAHRVTTRRDPGPIYLRAAVAAALVAPFLLWAPTSALAIPEEPPPAWSYYENSTSTSLANEEGCSQGLADKVLGTNSEVILDFGGQTGNLKETESIEGTIKFTFAQIEAISEEFASGYFACTGATETLTLGIGTNSSKEAVTTAGGKAWAGVIKTVAGHVLENKEGPLMSRFGVLMISRLDIAPEVRR